MGVRGRQRAVQLYRGQIPSPGRPTAAWREDRVRFWAGIARGIKTEDAAAEAGVSSPVAFRWFRNAGGREPGSGPDGLGPLPLFGGAGGHRTVAGPGRRCPRDRPAAGPQPVDLRSILREYFPAAVTAFHVKHIGLASPEARTILAAAPTPAAAARLTKARLRSLLIKSGRTRNLDKWVERLHSIFRADVLRHGAAVEDAYGHAALAALKRLDAAVTAAEEGHQAATVVFEQHPHAAIVASFPGVGNRTGARILAELGDDPDRFQDARALKAYAGAAPVTRASGKAQVWSCTGG